MVPYDHRWLRYAHSHIQNLFVSVYSTIDVTTINYEESEVKKAIVEVSKQVIALTPYERINTAEALFICPISSVDMIITDDVKHDETKKIFAESGVIVI
ncbi:MAG: hypothetical protein ABIQ21_09050 [Chryseolinea sp.]